MLVDFLKKRETLTNFLYTFKLPKCNSTIYTTDLTCFKLWDVLCVQSCEKFDNHYIKNVGGNRETKETTDMDISTHNRAMHFLPKSLPKSYTMVSLHDFISKEM